MVDLSQPVRPTERQAALLLHALGDADQAWLLARLDEAERVKLLPLLRELQQLGIPQDATLTRELGMLGDSTPRQGTSMRDAIAQASAVEVDAALKGEPAVLIARLLDLGPWPWERELVSLIGPALAQTVRREREPSTARVAPRLDAALLGQVAHQLADLRSKVEQP